VRAWKRFLAAWDAAPLLTRIRWAFLVATFNTMVPGVLLRFVPTGLTTRRLAVALALAALWLVWLLARRVERVPWWSVAAEAGVCTTLVAVSDPPSSALGVLTTALLLRSLYGPRWTVLARLAALLVGYLAVAVLRLPPDADAAAVGPLVGQMFALAVPTLFARLLHLTATRGDRGAARERAVLSAGTALLASEDPAEVAGKAVRAMLRATGAGADVEVAIVPAAGLPPRASYAPVRDHLAGPAVQRLEGAAAAAAARELGLSAPAAALTLLPLRVETNLLGALVVAGPQPVPWECDGALTTLAAELALAFDRQRLDAGLRHSEQRYRSLVQHSGDVVLVVDRDGAVRSVSEAVREVAGLDPAAVLGAPLADLVHQLDRDLVRDLLQRMRERRPTPTLSWRLLRVDGGYVEVEAAVTNLLDDAAVRGIVLNLRDVSVRKQAEERWRWQALRDPLTGLANRTLFADRLRQALAHLGRRPGSVAVLLLDLDDLKEVNDTLGHGMGDELLVTTSQRIRSVLRPGDTAARLGGDEFAVLLERPADAAEAVAVARRIADALHAPVALGDRTRPIRASIGVALGREGVAADALLRQADQAMYAVKSAGKDGIAVYPRGTVPVA
jgi:diguanylate cyclase (GGDEF)-like protein/PAS domain S-box-containing protein